MGRPVDPAFAEIVETDGDRTVGPIEGHVQLHRKQVTAAWSTMPSARSQSIASLSSAASRAPVKNSHSARCSSSAKVSPYRAPSGLRPRAPRRR